MTWLKFLVGLLSFVGSLTSYLQRREIIENAQADVILKNTEASIDIISKALNARKSARDKFDAANGVPDVNDPHLRDREGD